MRLRPRCDGHLAPLGACLFSAFRLHGIPLHDLAAFVDGEGGFAGGEGDAAEVAAGAFACGFCPAEGFLRVVEVVGGEHCGGKVRRNVDGFCQRDSGQREYFFRAAVSSDSAREARSRPSATSPSRPA